MSTDNPLAMLIMEICKQEVSVAQVSPHNSRQLISVHFSVDRYLCDCG